MIFGFKQVPFKLITLLNDDVETPTRMIGQKMVPILEMMDGRFMPESMDIVDYIDRHYGEPIMAPSPDNAELNTWLEEKRACSNKLTMPRWVKSSLEEFATPSARDYFQNKKEDMIGSFDEHLANSDALIVQANNHLQILEPLIQSDKGVHGHLTEDDIHLFASLRSLSIVKGLVYPTKVEAYRQYMSESAMIPLHDSIAL
jgi:glutaredoxin 2